MAGESAREVARRNREKAERLLRVAQTYERGAQGEEMTASALARLDADQWRVIHDLRWPGRRYANIDHLVIGPGGIFVIDSKHWSGRVELRGQVLLQDGRRREKAVAAAADSAIAVAELLPGLNPDLVQPVLCFVRDEPVAGWARDVIVCSTSNVVAMLESRKPVFVQPEVQRQLHRLQGALSSATMAPPPVASATVRPGVPGHRTRVATTGGRRRRVPSQTRRKGGGASLFAGLALVVFAVLASQSGFLRDLTTRLVEAQALPSVAEGEHLQLKGGPSRPPLEIAESRIVRAVPLKASEGPSPGQTLWAVRFTVRNVGQMPLPGPWPITARVIDGEGMSHLVEPRVTGVRQGRLLPLTRAVVAGGTASGFLIFQLPVANKISEVRVTYGAERARWKLGTSSR